MKKTILANILMLLFVVSLLTACGNVGNDSDDIPDYVFSPKIINIPTLHDGWEIADTILVGDVLYIIADYQGLGVEIHNQAIFIFDIENSNLTKLQNYSAPYIPNDATWGQTIINAVHIDDDSYIWVIESGSFYRTDHSNEVDTDVHPFGRNVNVGIFNFLRKLDNSGAERISVNINNIVSSSIFESPVINIDGDGNIFVAISGAIHVFDAEGYESFKLSVQSETLGLINMPDGSVAHFGLYNNESTIRVIDTASDSWGDTIFTSQHSIQNTFQGNSEFLALFNTNTGLYGIEHQTYEVIKILDWVDSNIFSIYVNNIGITSDYELLVTSRRWHGHSARVEVIDELFMLTKTPISELPERISLTLATLQFEREIQNAVWQFNNNSSTHRIHVIDYSALNVGSDQTAGLTRLTTDIISGRAPDILDLTYLPFDSYVARGFLMDLNPFLDADPTINRSDLFGNILNADEVEGNLYRISPTFRINTIMGHPAVVGNDEGWTIEEFRAVLETNSQADVPLGANFTNRMFLYNAFNHNHCNFVNWESGTVYFDSAGFIELLELANLFPSGARYLDMLSNVEIMERRENIRTGRQIMIGLELGGIQRFQSFRADFGGDAVLMGWPSEYRSESKIILDGGIAITANTDDAQGVWEFVRIFLTDDFQRDYVNINFSFPINRNIFTEELQYAIERVYAVQSAFVDDDGNIVVFEAAQPLTIEEAEQILINIETISHTIGHNISLWNIIEESASDFFNGSISVEDAVRIIQNRATTFIAEQG